MIDITDEASLDDRRSSSTYCGPNVTNCATVCCARWPMRKTAASAAERDRREAEQYGGSKLARDLLPVYDNLRRALDAAGEEQRAAASGVIEGRGADPA
jgi:hypothetical protein